MSGITSKQRRIYTECKKEIKKVFDKYKEQGYFELLATRKTCFASTERPYIVFDVGIISNSDLPTEYFGFYFNMYKGVSSLSGDAIILLCSEDSICRAALEKIKNKDKWIKFTKDFIDEINKVTLRYRFFYKKVEEEA